MIFKTIIVFLLGVLFMLICVLGIRDGTPPTFSARQNNNNNNNQGIDVITRSNDNNYTTLFHDRFLHFVTQLKQDKIPFHVLTHTRTDLWLTFTQNLHDYLQVKYKYLPTYTTSHCFYLYDNAYVHLPKKKDSNDNKIEDNKKSMMCVTLFGMSDWRESFLHHFNVKTYSFHTIPLNVDNYNIHPGIVMINRHGSLTEEDIRSLWHKDSRYILYNFQDVSLFPNMSSTQYVLIQPLRTSNFTHDMKSLNNNNTNNNNYSYFYDEKRNLLLLPPASHLTPYEINKNANVLTKKLLQHQANSDVVFICVKESPQYIHDKLLAFEKTLLALEHDLNVQIVPNPSREKQQEYIQQSALCVVIQTDEEVLDQYVSPDIVQHLSYGRIVLTNNIHAQDIISNKFIVAKTNLHELITEGLQLQKNVSVDEFKLFMPFIPTLTQHINQLVKHNFIDI